MTRPARPRQGCCFPPFYSFSAAAPHREGQIGNPNRTETRNGSLVLARQLLSGPACHCVPICYPEVAEEIDFVRSWHSPARLDPLGKHRSPHSTALALRIGWIHFRTR